jgi:hypothetical protein
MTVETLTGLRLNRSPRTVLRITENCDGEFEKGTGQRGGIHFASPFADWIRGANPASAPLLTKSKRERY